MFCFLFLCVFAGWASLAIVFFRWSWASFSVCYFGLLFLFSVDFSHVAPFSCMPLDKLGRLFSMCCSEPRVSHDPQFPFVIPICYV